MPDLLWNLLAFFPALLVLPGVIYLLVLTIAGSRSPRTARAAEGWPGRIAIIVPAHNEAGGMTRTVENLCALARDDGAAEVIVVADNCTDETAAVAREGGARVLERENPALRGKGYALDFAFSTLAPEHFDAYLVIDADTLAESTLLAVIRQHFAQGVEAMQVCYGVLNVDESARNRMANLALTAFNRLRPRGRARLGWSAGILGNGFVLQRGVIERVPYSATSVVEDLEYHLRLIEAGVHVDFSDETMVRGEMPVGAGGQKSQRARWEGGRLRMLVEHGPLLLGRVLRGQFRFLEPLLDLWLLPLAYHALLLVTLLFWPLAWARVLGGSGLLILVLHVMAAGRVGGLSFREFLAVLLQIPGYVLWKIGVLWSTLRTSRQSARWVRTARRHES